MVEGKTNVVQPDDAPGVVEGADAPDIRVEPRFDFCGADYRELFARSNATAFQHPVWLTEFYRRLVPARGGEAMIVTGRDDRGDLVFVLPMVMRTINHLRVIEAADLGVSDYCAPVVRRDWAACRHPSPIGVLPRDLLPPHAVLRIGKIRPEHVDLWRLFFPHETARSPFSAHETALGDDYALWRERALTRSFAKYLDRRERRFFKAGEARLERLESAGDIAAGIAEIARLRAGRFEGDPIQDDVVRGFYVAVAIEGAGSGYAHTWRLALDGEAIGHAFGVTHAGRFCYLLIGCDYDRHGRHSPGLILYDGIVERWIAEGGDIFDFTIGDESFKADFGTAAVPIHHIRRANSALGRLGLAALDLRERIADLRKAD